MHYGVVGNLNVFKFKLFSSAKWSKISHNEKIQVDVNIYGKNDGLKVVLANKTALPQKRMQMRAQWFPGDSVACNCLVDWLAKECLA